MRAIVRLAARRSLLALPDLALYARISVLRSAHAVCRSFEIVAAAFGHHASFDARPPRSAVQVN